jgi:hypothetical protein
MRGESSRLRLRAMEGGAVRGGVCLLEEGMRGVARL